MYRLLKYLARLIDERAETCRFSRIGYVSLPYKLIGETDTLNGPIIFINNEPPNVPHVKIKMIEIGREELYSHERSR